MAPRRSRSPLRRRLLVWIALLFAGTTLVRALVGDTGLLQVWRHRRQAAAVEREIRTLRADNESLRAEIRSLRTDPRAIEPIAREELGYAAEGEVVILFPRLERPGAALR